VDNLPLRDLLDNDKKLQKQVDEALDAASGKQLIRVDKTGLAELRPYTLPGRPGEIFVAPGTFFARMDSPSQSGRIGAYERNTGWEGKPETDSSDTAARKVPFTEESRGMNGAGRTSLVRVRKDETGQDISVTIPEWSTDDFPGEAPAARIDLVYITSPVGFEEEGWDSSRAQLGVVKGAGQLSNEVLSRHLGKTVNEMYAYSAEDVDLETDWLSVPMPEDIINHTGKNHFGIEGVEWNAVGISNMQEGRGFVLPVCYVMVTHNYTAGTTIPAGNIIDIRPFLRTAELSLDERQAILNSSEFPRANNPFATESWVNGQIAAIPPPIVPGDYGIAGRIQYYYVKNDGQTLDTLPVTLPAGRYLAFVFGHIAWETTGELQWGIMDVAKNSLVDSPSHSAERGAQNGIYGNADDDCWFSDCIDITLPEEAVVEARGDDEVITKKVVKKKRRWYWKDKKYTVTTKKKNTLNVKRMLLVRYDD